MAKGKSQWASSSSGPDWTDVAMLIHAIQTMHRVTIAIGMTGSRFTGPALQTHISAVKHDDPASLAGSRVLDMRGEWPCPEHKDLVACIFDGLYKLDFEISKRLYEQDTMWPEDTSAEG